MAQSDDQEKRARLEMLGLILAFLASVSAFYELFFGFDDLKFLLPGLCQRWTFELWKRPFTITGPPAP